MIMKTSLPIFDQLINNAKTCEQLNKIATIIAELVVSGKMSTTTLVEYEKMIEDKMTNIFNGL